MSYTSYKQREPRLKRQTEPPAAPEARFRQLDEIARSADEDAAECAIADLAREFPTQT